MYIYIRNDIVNLVNNQNYEVFLSVHDSIGKGIHAKMPKNNKKTCNYPLEYKICLK